ncbi:hypothetical protein D3C85_1378400 [compost metagenome]
MSVFLVPQANFQAVFVPVGTQQTHLHPGFFNQGVEGHGGAVDAQVAVANDFSGRATDGVGDLGQAVTDGEGAILGG